MTFPIQFIDLIRNCISSLSLSVLWTGNKLSAFSSTKGLRQGDPLSPLLFVICMDTLSRAISTATDNYSWKPVKLSRNGTAISHIFFADDIILFSKAHLSQVNLMKRVLDSFVSLSGLRVNYNKSRAVASVVVPMTLQYSFKMSTSIQFTQSLDSYLGFSIIQGRMNESHFDHLLEKLTLKVKTWSTKISLQS